jgi:hypothetical protein
MRWYILRTLLHKELLRHLAERGGLVLALLLVGMALLLSFGKTSQQAGLLTTELQKVHLVYKTDDPAAENLKEWLVAIRRQAPPELRKTLVLQSAKDTKQTEDGLIQLKNNAAMIMVQSNGQDTEGRWRYRVEFWYPGDDNGLLSPYEAWFWRESHQFFQQPPQITEKRERIQGSADMRSFIAAALVLFALFFTCVYLLPSLTCEERERGVLLAQALSPASPLEILGAKFLFYPVIGVGLAGLIGTIYAPSVLSQPFFWLTLIVTAMGSLGIGLSIASVARTQRLASMTALCYMLMVAFFLFICQQNSIAGLPRLVLEWYAPNLLHAALSNYVQLEHWRDLGGMFVVALAWATLAVVLFRKRGWQ